MDAGRLGSLTRSQSFTIGATRRGILGGVAAALGLEPLGLLVADAKKNKHKNKRKTRKKPLVLNTFGCIDVGQACRGNDANCCSGICQGKKPKKSERDQSRCLAHDTGGCTATATKCGMAPTCTTTVARPGGCLITTGNAPYCADFISCFPCTKDEECVPFCGPLAACVLCPGSCPETGDRHCAGPGVCDF